MKRLLCLVSIILILISCSGCDTIPFIRGGYPYEKSTHWYCEEIDFTLSYSKNAHDILVPDWNTLCWNGQELLVQIDFSFGNFTAIAEIDGDPSGISQEDIVLAGDWDYRGENMVVTLYEDTVFNGQFKELVFVPVG